jgi:hypothetical protein
MKKLVLGAALVVAVTSVGCTTSDGGSDEVAVPVSWKFTELSTNSSLGCPQGFGTARIVSQVIDERTHLGTGQEFTDLFNCSDLHGTIGLPPEGQFLIWVEIESNSGGTLYAQSQETLYDTEFDTGTVDAEIIDDGGFFFLEWDLYDASNRLVGCSDAGSSSVEVIATALSSGTESTDDKFDCADHYGVTDPVIAGTYQVAIEALDSADRALGDGPPVTKNIVAPGGYTDLGLVKIQLDP